jgi:glycosyltransferase involved in cell wall biosynthesis
MNGVNLISDLRIRRGLGESARAILASMQQANIPVSYHELRYEGFPPDQCDPVDPDLPVGNPYPVNLMVYGLADFPALSEDRLRAVTDGKYTIACWLWEFPELPMQFRDQLNRVDEIWTPSRFCQRIFARYTDRPIHVIPLPITVHGARDRAAFELPEDRYVFLYVFDAAGSIARKNPLGVVSAYAMAFPERTNRDPLLVLRARHLMDAPRASAEAIYDAVARVGGRLITAHLSRGKADALTASADAYISLHRAEGFGMTIAEAMAAGKPTIATAYSGNLDFMSESTALYVDYRLRPVTPEDHADQPHFEALYAGMTWAEPDLPMTARYMRYLAENPAAGIEMGLRAAAQIQAFCGAEVVGQKTAQRFAAR